MREGRKKEGGGEERGREIYLHDSDYIYPLSPEKAIRGARGGGGKEGEGKKKAALPFF